MQRFLESELLDLLKIPCLPESESKISGIVSTLTWVSELEPILQADMRLNENKIRKPVRVR